MIFTYMVTIDCGGAPCIHNNILSLGICKPMIRRYATVNNIIIGFCAKSMKLSNSKPQILFIAKISEKITYKNYYDKYKVRPDCIYDNDLNLLKNDFHTSFNVQTDLSGQNVLISKDFIFFGNNHISISNELQYICPNNQGYWSRKNTQYSNLVHTYFELLKSKYCKIEGKHIHCVYKCKTQKQKCLKNSKST